ncbi:Protein of unknown function [Actinokineospora alba]|uniref:DUF3307 domain-containing protein n=1 Tax=Actinokineospora alba TaxID=504798 RepID=A0A1H0VAK8_9PSEU|nr:DUF3307 domain-containing protein [Actinokineospora alba]TDP65575.1 uncharacterized protein DUF3307 [Actinokineospora alba]SDH65824.1 Protein of unknown function [Actinokineospora alba]SDP75265.1 Protein of unknown function [Actinokineospora alba]
MSASGLTFAVLLPGLLVAHNVADHWVQSSHQAGCKGLPGWAGRRACAAHVLGYTVVTAWLVVGLWVAFDLSISLPGFLLGQVISAVTHYWADRRTTLAWLARIVGRAQFYRMGAPRENRDDNPSLGTGAYALDQSWHWLWLGVAAFVTAVA